MPPLQPVQDPEQVRDLLRKVRFPGRSRDVVALGFVKRIAIQGSSIEIEFTPDSINVEKVAAMEAEARALLSDLGFTKIELHTEPPYDDASMLLGGTSVNPLQIDLKEYGLDPIPDQGHGGAPHLKDLLGAGEPNKTQPPRTTPTIGAFVEPQEPPPGDGPLGNTDPTYNGQMPVFQWQVDPEAPTATGQKVRFSIGSWNYAVLWLVHSGQDLVYASIQARHWVYYQGKAKPNPAGRTEAVNLVFDLRRNGVVAIYGTVKDFRPFVEAFRRAWTGEAGAPAHASDDDTGVSAAVAQTPVVAVRRA